MPEHLPRADNGIPVIKVDRGGQVTYHGPGQLVAYALVDLRRRGLSVRDLVRVLEQAVIDLLSEFGIAGAQARSCPRRLCRRSQGRGAGVAHPSWLPAITG